jgi:hypothetical protein
MPAFNICCIDLRSDGGLDGEHAGPPRGGHIMHAGTV